MADLIRNRTLAQVTAERESAARRVFGNLLQTGTPQTVENLLIRMMGATGYAHDRVTNTAGEEIFLTRATGAFLDAKGAEYNVRRGSPTFARGSVRFDGTTGVTVPASTRIRASNGAEFTSDAAVTIDANGQVIVDATATKTGLLGNIDSRAVTLVLADTVAGVTGVIPLASFVGGDVEETDDEYRERVLERSRRAVSGGNAGDWNRWTLAIPNVRAVRVFDPVLGGQVILYVAMTREARPPYGVPDDADITTITNELEARRPLTTKLLVQKVRTVSVDVSITGVVPNSPALHTVIETAITAYLNGLKQVGGTFYLKGLRDVLSTVGGLEDYTLTLPDANISLNEENAPNGIPIRGNLNVAS